MSRIGREPINVPAGVEVTIDANANVITVKGPKGTLNHTYPASLTVSKEGNVVKVERHSDEKEYRALHGLTRSLINNMVVGVTSGFSKTLEINGVGYRVALQGKSLNLTLGYSHPVIVDPIDGITFEVPNTNTVVVSGADKQKVGEVAAQIRGKRPPEPYLGKGIKYAGEKIRRKSGKAGKS
ncbi:MAG: 50S ribosomal protein L6 [Clostridia bacterium]|nr:50S ribosomal protein L6 [Clostridia bacterium]